MFAISLLLTTFSITSCFTSDSDNDSSSSENTSEISCSEELSSEEVSSQERVSSSLEEELSSSEEESSSSKEEESSSSEENSSSDALVSSGGEINSSSSEMESSSSFLSSEESSSSEEQKESSSSDMSSSSSMDEELSSSSIDLSNYTVPQDKDSLTLIWSDEFNDDTINDDMWTHDEDNGFWNYLASAWVGGWGNNELQYYRGPEDNIEEKDGNLSIIIKDDVFPHPDPDVDAEFEYTSARVKTKITSSILYGRIEVRARLPIGKGLWPAIWLLPSDFDKTIGAGSYGGWASSGEIDIMEAKGRIPNKISGAMHFGDEYPKNTFLHREKELSNSTINEYHIYALEWEPKEIRWYLDGEEYFKVNSSQWWTSKSDDESAPFDKEFHLIMNVAVGGNFDNGIKPDDSVTFPATMDIDYVRYYR